jgi:hypothetical protein
MLAAIDFIVYAAGMSRLTELEFDLPVFIFVSGMALLAAGSLLGRRGNIEYRLRLMKDHTRVLAAIANATDQEG